MVVERRRKDSVYVVISGGPAVVVVAVNMPCMIGLLNTLGTWHMGLGGGRFGGWCIGGLVARHGCERRGPVKWKRRVSFVGVKVCPPPPPPPRLAPRPSSIHSIVSSSHYYYGYTIHHICPLSHAQAVSINALLRSSSGTQLKLCRSTAAADTRAVGRKCTFHLSQHHNNHTTPLSPCATSAARVLSDKAAPRVHHVVAVGPAEG